MAKKKRNPNVSQETLARARRELYGTSGPIVRKREEASTAPASAPRRAATATDLQAQYAYVLNDLRNMGILAAIFMTVLVILSFVI